MALRYKIKVMQKYTTKGEEKTRYIDIGAVLDGKNGGFILKLESIPVGWDGWAYLSDPADDNRQRGGNQQRGNQQRSAPPAADDDSDVPF